MKARSRREMAGRGPLLMFAATILLFTIGVASWMVVADGNRGPDPAHAEYVAKGEEAALALTTIRWQQAEKDIQRVLDVSSGPFHEDFEKRSKGLASTIEQSKTTSKGEITASALEDFDGDSAKVIVAVNVTTTHGDNGEPELSAWRLRVTIDNVDGALMMSKSEFVE